LKTDRPRWILSCYAIDRDQPSDLRGV
jgi:hypothetical protein